MPPATPLTAFEEFADNLAHARSLIPTGRALSALGAGSIGDVEDLYRAAWSQAVAGLDHWINREIVERAVALALDPELPRPARFLRLEIPMDVFENIHQGVTPLETTLAGHWRRHFSRTTFQRPEAIKEGLGHVIDGNLWVEVAGEMTASGARTSADQVRQRLREIVDRRNRIAHSADRRAAPDTGRTPLTADEAEDAIDWLLTMGTAILAVLGGPLKVAAEPAEITPERTRWEEGDLLAALDEHAPLRLRESLLAVYRHAETHPAFRGFSFGTAVLPSVTASFRIEGADVPVWSIYTGTERSVLSVNFEWMRRIPAERLDRLVDGLSELPGADRLLRPVAASNYARRPSLTPDMLAGHADLVTKALDELLAGGSTAFRMFPEPLDDTVAWQSPLEERLAASAAEAGFLPSHATKKMLELVDTDRAQVVYLDRTKLPSESIVVVVPPWTDLGTLASNSMLGVSESYFHNSNLRAFPRRRHLGAVEISHGHAIICRTEEAFQWLLTTV
uniref:hypothetical protein n=1 Tax=Herbidospora sakaeratensis TaxID=564415 RepID=UPI00078659A7|nr:hypothetical protein [Herbidospora sakaeratensis]